MNSSKLSQNSSTTNRATDRVNTVEMVGGTGPIAKAISRRRTHRQQWRIFECIAMIILDAWLISVSFQWAYLLRVYLASQPNFVISTLNNVRTNLLENDPQVGKGLAAINSPQFLSLQIAS